MSLSEAQLELRRTGITATDAVILSGCSRWGHPLEVWEQKMGAPSKPTTLAMAMGHAVEPVVMDLVARKYGLKVQDGATVRHRIFRHFLATPDRFVADEPVVLTADQCMSPRSRCEAVCEGKLVGWNLVGEWLDEDNPEVRVFPDSVAVQTCWQMAMTYTKKNYVGALLGGWRDDDFHHLVVDFDEDLWGAVRETCDRFWVDHVLTKRPPPPDASERAAEALGRIYRKMRRPVLEPATSEESAMLARYVEINATMKQLDVEKLGIANALKYRLGETEGIRDGERKATWRNQAAPITVADLVAHYGTSEDELAEIRAKRDEGRPDNGEARVLRVAKLTKKEAAYDQAMKEIRDDAANHAAE